MSLWCEPGTKGAFMSKIVRISSFAMLTVIMVFGLFAYSLLSPTEAEAYWSGYWTWLPTLSEWIWTWVWIP
jgi:hypothetical protein